MDLEGTVRPVVEASGLELVEVAFHQGGGRRVVRVTVDRDGGVDLDAIAAVSERIGRRLDLEGSVPGPYTLEVSSPGVERPLREPRDFSRRVGERVKVKVAEPEDGTLVGTIVGADEDRVRISTESEERSLPYGRIASARTVFEWGPGSGKRNKAKGGTR